MRQVALLLVTTSLLISTGCAGVIETSGTGTAVQATGGDPRDTGPSHDQLLAEAAEALKRGDLHRASEMLVALDHTELHEVVAFLLEQRPHAWPSNFPLLQQHLDRETIDTLRGTLSPHTLPGAYVHTRGALAIAHQTGDLSAAKALVSHITDETLSAALHRVIGHLERRQQNMRQRTLGVLLPLSGPHAGIGEAALRAIQLALRGSGLRLVIKDTRGEAETAARQVDALVHEHGAISILGPVGAFETTAAVRRAGELSVPIMALSNREGLAEVGPVSRTRVTASRQGVRMARYAVGEMGLHRFGLLINDSPYGWALAGAFWDEVIRLEGTVTRVVTYPRGSQEYRATVQKLVGGRREGRQANLPFEGLFIADNYQGVQGLLPFLPYWGVRVRRTPGSRRGVQLLGAAGWNHHGIVDEAEQLTDNAVFCDSFFPDDSDPKARDFVRRFYRQHREPPSPFEAEVFVAAMVLKRAMRADSSHTRNGVSQTLRDMRSFRSATGMLRFSEQGDIRQDIVILTVDRDQIRPRNSEAEERVIRRQDR